MIDDPWEGDERRQRARKVDPRYREGPLVSVAGARNLTEADAVIRLTDKGLTIGERERRFNEKVRSGNVIKSDPAAGAKAGRAAARPRLRGPRRGAS